MTVDLGDQDEVLNMLVTTAVRHRELLLGQKCLDRT